MPFDGLNSVTSLSDAARFLGITPISNDFLEAYKAEQVRKNPGSWWYHHPALALLLTLFGTTIAFIGVIGGYASLVTTGGSSTSLIMTLCSAVISYGIIRSRVLSVTNPLRVKGPARWQTSLLGWEDNVPDSIMSMAHAITRMLPNCTLVVGKLVQNERVIDPYLIVQYHDEQICLGIWDETGILHIRPL